jgi:hypothetical protein
MKRIILSLVLVFGTTLGCSSAFAAIKPCDDLKAEIAEKLKAKGVDNYALEVIAAGEVKEQKVVGSCDGGSKRVIYSRGNKAAQAQASAAPAAKTAQAEASPAAPAANSAAKAAPAANAPAASKAAPAAAAPAAPAKTAN